MREQKPVDDYTMLVKYKKAGMDDDLIAKRLGWTVAKVNNVWAELMKQVEDIQSTGYENLRKQWWIMCQQYELLGESLKIIGGQLQNVMPAPELAELITDNKEETFKNLTSKALVLRPFVFADPIASLEEHHKRVQKSN